MSKFKAGDRIRRRDTEGREAIVVHVSDMLTYIDNAGRRITIFGGIDDWELVTHSEPSDSPVRTVTKTVTKKEIVPGEYELDGHAQIDVDDVNAGGVFLGIKCCWFTPAALRQLASMCTEMADVLEDKQ